jgi:TIR domain
MGGATTRPSIFLGYRREDTADAAGRLYDALAARFGAGSVFMDVASIDPGTDFTEVVAGALASCDVLLALIGRSWLTAADAQGRPRLEDPGDLVRVELETALENGVPVIPVLVQGAQMPAADQLPGGLKALARRNAVEMSQSRWNYDLDQLTAALRKVPKRKVPGRSRPGRVTALAALGVVLAIAGSITAGVLLSSGSRGQVGAPPAVGSSSPRAAPSTPRPVCRGPARDAAEIRSGRLNGIPFSIEYPASWTLCQYRGVADIDLPGPGGGDISYLTIRSWTAGEAEQLLDSENEHVTKTTESHSGLRMTVLDWNNNSDRSSSLNANRGHQRFYGFQYHGATWDIDCGWGTVSTITPAQATAAESACVAAVNSVRSG